MCIDTNIIDTIRWIPCFKQYSYYILCCYFIFNFYLKILFINNYMYIFNLKYMFQFYLK